MATASKAKAPARKPAAKKQAEKGELPADVKDVEIVRQEKLGTTRAESIPAPKGVKEVDDVTVDVVDNAHAVLTINGNSVRLGQSDVSDLRKLLDAAFIQLH